MIIIGYFIKKENWRFFSSKNISLEPPPQVVKIRGATSVFYSDLSKPSSSCQQRLFYSVPEVIKLFSCSLNSLS